MSWSRISVAMPSSSMAWARGLSWSASIAVSSGSYSARRNDLPRVTRYRWTSLCAFLNGRLRRMRPPPGWSPKDFDVVPHPHFSLAGHARVDPRRVLRLAHQRAHDAMVLRQVVDRLRDHDAARAAGDHLDLGGSDPHTPADPLQLGIA